MTVDEYDEILQTIQDITAYGLDDCRSSEDILNDIRKEMSSLDQKSRQRSITGTMDISRRDYMATAIFAGMVSNPNMDGSADFLAKVAVVHADCLISALETSADSTETDTP